MLPAPVGPKIRADIVIGPLDVEPKGFYVLQLPEGRSFRISPYMFRLLSLFDGKRTIYQVACDISQLEGRTVSENEIRWIIETKLNPLGVLDLELASQAAKAIAVSRSSKLSFDLLEISPERLRPFVACCQRGFSPGAVVVAVPAVIYVHIWLYRHIGIRALASLINAATPSTALVVVILIFICLGLHELGHLAAFYRFTRRCGTLRLGLVDLRPAGIASVAGVWSLSRSQRLVFDLGGAWFQVLATLIFYVLYALSGSSLLLVVLYLLDVGLVWVLIPTPKSDGYWLLTDILGVASLDDLRKGRKPSGFTEVENSDKRFPEIVLSRSLIALGGVSLAVVFLIGQWFVVSMIANIVNLYARGFADVAIGGWQALRNGQIVSLANETTRMLLPIAFLLGLLACSERAFRGLVGRARVLLSGRIVVAGRPFV